MNLDPVLEAARRDADANERAGRLSEPVLETIYAAQLFKLWVPRAAGGLELPVPEVLAIFEAVSYADGATGWNVMIGAGAGIFGGFLTNDAASEVLGGREDVIAGSGAPSGRMHRVEGGFRATGRWKYASGAPHATWFTANCLIEGEGTPVAPRIRAVAVPRSQVQVVETWDVTGMRATGSHDIAFNDVFVPDLHTFSVFDDEQTVAAALYRFPFASIAAYSFGAVALGIARRALDEFAALARTKTPGGGTLPLAELPVVQARYAEAATQVDAAGHLFHATAARQWADLGSSSTPSADDVTAAQAASNHAVHASARAIDLLHDVAGMDVLYTSSALGRCWRDVHALTQNRAVSVLRWEDHGREMLAPTAGATTP